MKTLSVKKAHISIIIFGALLAILVVILQFIEYRYIIGSLGVDIYTGAVATIFTGVGIWVGSSMLKRKKVAKVKTEKIDHEKIKDLKLNDREYEVLILISKGYSNQEIANQLYLALPTIKTHTSNLYSKLDVNSRTQAIYKAQNLHLI